MFETVPSPGFSFSGNQIASTIALMRKVASPTVKFVFFETPCANTAQGELPRPALKRNASPNPNKVRPKNKIIARKGVICQRFFEVQGVVGMVRAGRKKAINLFQKLDSNIAMNISSLGVYWFRFCN